MTSQLTFVSMGMRFLGAIAASITFILCLFLAVQVSATMFVGDATFAASRNFWMSFGTVNFAKLIFGLSLVSIAISVSTDRLISWFVSSPQSMWFRNALSYFTALFTVLALSTASFFLASFPNLPATHVVAIIVMIVSSFIASLVYSAVCGIKFAPARRAPKLAP